MKQVRPDRLAGVTTAGGETVTFAYDGNGWRAVRDTITDTVVYVGPHYEVRFEEQDMPEDLDGDCLITVIDIMQVVARWGMTDADPDWDPRYDLDGDGEITVADIMMVAAHWRETCERPTEAVKYYTLGGRRVAMRRVPVGQAGTLYYLFTDHLGSTSVTYDTTTSQAQTMRYYPWGGVRSGDVPTDRRFTGQRWDGTIGLYDYNARYYDPALGRFIQPDPLVPEPGNPQALNRYAYALNNPVRYRDSSGYWVETAWDIANILWDIYEVRRDPSLLNIEALVVDVGAVLLPLVPAGVGMVVRGGKAAKAIAHADELVDAARALSRTDEAANLIRRLGLSKFFSGEVAEEAIQRGFRKFTERSFRENLRRLTGKTVEEITNLEAHHVLPRKFAKRFEKVGLNIYDPTFGAWVERGPHRRWSWEYNRAWENFFKRLEAQGLELTEKRVLEQAQILARRYGFDVYFKVP